MPTPVQRSRFSRLARWLPSFQFSIANLFLLTSLAAVSLALGRLNGHAGGMLAVLLYGAWLAAALARIQWFRATYFVGAFVAGLLWYVLLSAPFTPISAFFESTFPNFPLAMFVCLASLQAAAVFRLLGLHEPGYFPLVSGALLALATAMCFCLMAAAVYLVVELWQGTLGASLQVSLLDVAVLALTAFALSCHVLVPCGCLVLYMLREAERMALEAAREERSVYDAVDELERQGQEPILPADVAREAMLEADRVDQCLLTLRRKEFLDYTAEAGYFCR